MGLFATTTTFLVGLLSIFIGNNGKVSIFEKIEYVIALGFILLMFICIGYIATSEVKKNKGKTAFFLFLLIVFLRLFDINIQKHRKIKAPMPLKIKKRSFTKNF